MAYKRDLSTPLSPTFEDDKKKKKKKKSPKAKMSDLTASQREKINRRIPKEYPKARQEAIDSFHKSNLKKPKAKAAKAALRKASKISLLKTKKN